MTIDDLLSNKTGLAGPAQESLATRTLRSKKAEVRSKNSELRNPQSAIRNLKFNDIPTSVQDSPRENVLENQEQEQAAGMSLREQVIRAKQEEARKKSLAGEAEEAAGQVGSKAAKVGTSRLLEMSWLNLIDSFGLTLIYINIHVFLRWVLGEKFFCKLGEEWMPKKIAGAVEGAGQVAGKTAGIAEVVLLIFLDLIAGAIILALLALIVMIVTWMGMSWWGKLGTIFSAIWNLGFSSMTALVSLFGGLAP